MSNTERQTCSKFSAATDKSCWTNRPETGHRSWLVVLAICMSLIGCAWRQSASVSPFATIELRTSPEDASSATHEDIRYPFVILWLVRFGVFYGCERKVKVNLAIKNFTQLLTLPSSRTAIIDEILLIFIKYFANIIYFHNHLCKD